MLFVLTSLSVHCSVPINSFPLSICCSHSDVFSSVVSLTAVPSAHDSLIYLFFLLVVFCLSVVASFSTSSIAGHLFNPLTYQVILLSTAQSSCLSTRSLHCPLQCVLFPPYSLLPIAPLLHRPSSYHHCMALHGSAVLGTTHLSYEDIVLSEALHIIYSLHHPSHSVILCVIHHSPLCPSCQPSPSVPSSPSSSLFITHEMSYLDPFLQVITNKPPLNKIMH